MEKKEKSSKLISSLVALSLATTLGVPTIALADTANAEQPTATQQQAVDGANGQIATQGHEGESSATTAVELPAADSNGVITLEGSHSYSISKDLKSSIVVAEGANISLTVDEGATLTNTDGQHTITNNGTLTITGGGTVDNVSPGRGAVVNKIGATVILNGCTFTRSEESGQDAEHSGGNSWYTIDNQGSMTITGSKVSVDGGFSSNIRNGGDDSLAKDGAEPAKLVVNSGDFSGGLNTIKNDSYGVLTINGGSFKNTKQHVVMNWNEATIKGGTFEALPSASATLFSSAYGAGANEGAAGKLNIEGGTFTTTSANQKCIRDYYDEDNKGTVSITGGTFSDPDVYQYATGGNVNVAMAANYNGNVVVPKGVTSTLDLNGHTFSGGTVAGKAALTNNGAITIKDSASNGKICREDNGAKGYYTIDNQGTMTIESGSVYNSTGLMPAGSSLIRNAGNSTEATLNITGGTIKQDGFIAVKNDDHGVLNISGGTIETTGEFEKDGEIYTPSAVQNWSTANITAGTINGAVWTSVWDDNLPNSKTTLSGTAKVNGAIITKRDDTYSKPESAVPSTVISGGSYNVGRWVVEDNSWVSITGGAFSSDPSDYVASGYEAVKSGSTYTVQVPYTPAPSPTTETTTTTNPDGTTTTTVTNKETGESTSTTEGANGTTVVEKTDASGNTTTDITVPEEAVDAAAGAPVEVPDAIEVAEGQEISISAPAGTVVAVPISESNAGNVAVIVHADGTETVIPMSLVEDGKAIVQLDGNETIKIVDNAKEFTDVADDYWAAEDIDFASSHEIFKGIGNGNTYEPETALTRNMMMTVLARTAGADTSDSDPWYAKGQAWAVENGVSNGLWGEDNITREQLVTMLFNFANLCGLDTSARADVSGMVNAGAVSDWATEAVQWAVAEGILKGVDNIDLAPQGLATRAQAAAFMQRYVKTALL